MDDSIPSISSGAVGSRFVTQTDLDSAKARRDEQWKAAYARLGQEPPPQPTEDTFDGRSLAEKLAANKAAKQDEWEERNRLANQFRALEEDEVLFLDSLRERQEAEERERAALDSEEVKSFKQAVAARDNAAAKPPQPAAASPPPAPTTAAAVASTAAAAPPKPAAKKNALKGVVVKKKKSVAAAPKAAVSKDGPVNKDAKADEAPKKAEDEPAAKRRKL